MPTMAIKQPDARSALALRTGEPDLSQPFQSLRMLSWIWARPSYCCAKEIFFYFYLFLCTVCNISQILHFYNKKKKIAPGNARLVDNFGSSNHTWAFFDPCPCRMQPALHNNCSPKIKKAGNRDPKTKTQHWDGSWAPSKERHFPPVTRDLLLPKRKGR